MYTFIMTWHLNDVVPKAWLADVFPRISDLSVSRLNELLLWQWKKLPEVAKPSLSPLTEQLLHHTSSMDCAR